MANLPLATVEGSGNFNPAGTVVSVLVPTGTRVFDNDGVLYAKDNTPGYAIPNFDTKVPSYLKGLVSTPSYINFQEVAQGPDRMAAGIASDGTIMRFALGYSGFNIERKKVTDPQFVTMKTGGTYSQGSASPAFVETDNNGRWLIAFRGALLISLDDGVTWSERWVRQNADTYAAIKDVKFGTGGVVLLSARISSGNTAYYLFRSTDYGLNWTQVASESGPASMCRTTGTNWIAILNSSANTRQSSDDGATWTAGPTLPFTVSNDSNGNCRVAYSNGRFYVKSDVSVYSGTALASVVALSGAASATGFGVDVSGNCLVTSGGSLFKSIAGANFVAVNCRSTFMTGLPFDIKFANGTWVDLEGSYISHADVITGNKSLTAWAFANNQALGGSNYGTCVDTSASGVTLLVLNYNSYLRTTDGFKTWEIHNFNVHITNGTYPFPTGVATDDFGNWVVTFNGCSQLAYSSDNGLTWVIKTNPATNNLGVAGGGGSGKFLVAENNGTACHYTGDGFNTSTPKTINGTDNAGCSNPVYCDNGFFAFIGNVSNTSSRLLVVNAATGASTTHFLTTYSATGSNSPLFVYKGTLYIGNSSYMHINTSAGPIEGVVQSGTVSSVYNGVPHPAGSFGTSVQVGPTTMAPVWASKGTNFYQEGIRNYSLTSTQFIKVT